MIQDQYSSLAAASSDGKRPEKLKPRPPMLAIIMIRTVTFKFEHFPLHDMNRLDQLPDLPPQRGNEGGISFEPQYIAQYRAKTNSVGRLPASNWLGSACTIVLAFTFTTGDYYRHHVV